MGRSSDALGALSVSCSLTSHQQRLTQAQLDSLFPRASPLLSVILWCVKIIESFTAAAEYLCLLSVCVQQVSNGSLMDKSNEIRSGSELSRWKERKTLRWEQTEMQKKAEVGRRRNEGEKSGEEKRAGVDAGSGLQEE